jgi:hypothetical protein
MSDIVDHFPLIVNKLARIFFGRKLREYSNYEACTNNIIE